ncbi:MAG: 50S ribosomal protein L4 [Chthoniobacterales bacterium]
MSATVLTTKEAEAAKIELITNGRGTQAVHDVVVAMRANRRSGSANTKTKAEVALTGRKPWRQKGTGRARAGYFSSPVWTGGGVVFGPKPRDYSKKITKGTKKLAFRKALSSRIIDGDVLLVDSFAVKNPKTKEFVALIAATAGDVKKTLVVSTAFDEATYKAGRNVKTTSLVRAADLNTEELLAFDKIIVTKDGLEQLSGRLA